MAPFPIFLVDAPAFGLGPFNEGIPECRARTRVAWAFVAFAAIIADHDGFAVLLIDRHSLSSLARPNAGPQAGARNSRHTCSII